MQQGLWALSDAQLRAQHERIDCDLQVNAAKWFKLETALELLKHRLADAAADNDVERCKYLQSLINTTRREIGSCQIQKRILASLLKGIEDEMLVRNPPRNPVGRNRYNPNQREGFWQRQERKLRNE